MSIRDIRQQAVQGGIITRSLEAWRLKHEREHGRKPDGYWHPSSLSGCPTASVYEKLGFVLPGAPFDARLLRIFDVGHAVHDMLQGQFIKAGIVPLIQWPEPLTHRTYAYNGLYTEERVPAGELFPAVEVPIQDEEYKLRGTLDVIFEIKALRFVGELKTKHSSSFAKMQDAQEEHKVQACCYHWKALDNKWVNTDYAVCLYFSKDDSHIAEFKVPMTETRIKALKDKIDLMNAMVFEYTAHDKFPEPYYKEPQKPPCRNCKWAQGCHATLERQAWIDLIKGATNAQPSQAPAQAPGTQPARKPPTRLRK
jgi:hypothetical protein